MIIGGLMRVLSMMVRFPRLFSFVKVDSMSSAEVYCKEDLYYLFQLPLSRLANDELIMLQNIIVNHLVLEEKDRWNYCCGKIHFSQILQAYSLSYCSV